MQIEADVPDAAIGGKPRDRQQAARLRGVLLDELLGQGAAHDQLDQVVLVDVGQAARLDEAAVAEHGIAVADAEDLGQAVADIDHPLAARLQRVDGGEQLVGLGLAQGRGRLVHDDDLGVIAQRLGDLDQLGLGHGQVHHQAVRADAELEPVQQRLGAAVHLAERDASEHPHRFAAQIDVLGHGHGRDGAQLLLDDRDAVRRGLGRVVEHHRLAVAQQGARIAVMDAHQDLEEGRLARAVAAAQRMHRSRLQPELAQLQRGNAVEGFAKARGLQQRRGHVVPPCRTPTGRADTYVSLPLTFAR